MNDKMRDALREAGRLGGKKLAAQKFAEDPDYFRRIGQKGGQARAQHVERESIDTETDADSEE
jgi:general stress protein YciG